VDHDDGLKYLALTPPSHGNLWCPPACCKECEQNSSCPGEEHVARYTHQGQTGGSSNADHGRFQLGTARGAKWSATSREHRVLEDWVREAGITEVIQCEKPRPTWKPSKEPQSAALDSALVSHSDLPSMQSVGEVGSISH
jgi:hypothetical protein